MFSIGDKVIYGENGVCTISSIAPLAMQGAPQDKLYYYLTPHVGTGTYFSPVESNAFMRSIITPQEAEELILSIPQIEPAICNDNRFNHVDAFYKELFKLHTCEALVAMVKGLTIRLSERKAKSSRAEITMKRAKDILYSELAAALGMEIKDMDDYLVSRIGTTL